MWGNKKEKRVPYTSKGNVWMIPITDIKPNPEQPRREFAEDKLCELAQSIRENGLLQPISVTFCAEEPILVAGERRLRAAQMAGLSEIACVEVGVSGVHHALLTLIENLQREDMNCFETAEGFRRLIEVYGLTQEDAARQLGCTQSTVANKLRLLRFPEEVRQQMMNAGLTERHARTLLRIENEELQQVVLGRVIEGKLTVVQTERMVEDCLAGKLKHKSPKIVIRDVRLFLNTVNHAVETMQRCGIEAKSEKTETEEYIEYTVRIPKRQAFGKTG